MLIFWFITSIYTVKHKTFFLLLAYNNPCSFSIKSLQTILQPITVVSWQALWLLLLLHHPSIYYYSPRPEIHFHSTTGNFHYFWEKLFIFLFLRLTSRKLHATLTTNLKLFLMMSTSCSSNNDNQDDDDYNNDKNISQATSVIVVVIIMLLKDNLIDRHLQFQ